MWHFPITDDTRELDPEDVSTDHSSFRNYAGVDGDESAIDEIEKRIKQKFVKSFDTLDQVKQFLGGADPVMSKIGLIVKTRAGVTDANL